MKRLLLSLLGLGILFVSCSPKHQDDRWEPNQQTQIAEADRRTILIEEYTGQRCINCPEAAREVHKIVQSYPKHAIVVSMHSEHSGLTLPELANSEATRLAKHYKLPNAIPGIMISRTATTEGRYNRTRSQWASDIARLINTPKTLDLELGAPQYDKAADRLTLPIKLKQIVGSRGQYQLTAWLVEDIEARQTTVDGIAEHYLHHNVLRRSLTEPQGIRLQLTGQEQQTTLSATGLKASVRELKNSKVVVFAQAPGQDEILTASIVALGEGIAPKPEEPDTPKEEDLPQADDITYEVDGKRYAADTEFVASHLEDLGGEYELISPIIYVLPGKKTELGSYLFEVKRESHKDNGEIGLSQVCADGQCIPTTSRDFFSSSLKLSGAAKTLDQSIQVHYTLGKTLPQEATDYLVSVTIYKKGAFGTKTKVSSFKIKFAYKPNEASQEDLRNSDAITYEVDDKRYAADTEFVASHLEDLGGEYELISPIIYVLPGKKTELGSYLFEVKRESHKDNGEIGLSQVCADGQCIPTTSRDFFSSSLKLSGAAKTLDQSIQVHYTLGKTLPQEATDYLVSVTIYQKGAFGTKTKVSSFKIKFAYKPKKS